MPATSSAPSRIVVTALAPLVEGGQFPLKRVVGEPVRVEATVLVDGHDRLHAVLAHRGPEAKSWTEVPMALVNPGLDRWQATFVPTVEGEHRFEVRAWIDRVATWRDGCRRKLDAGVDLAGDVLVGAALLDDLAGSARSSEGRDLGRHADDLRSGNLDVVVDDTAGQALEALAHRALRPAV